MQWDGIMGEERESRGEQQQRMMNERREKHEGRDKGRVRGMT